MAQRLNFPIRNINDGYLPRIALHLKKCPLCNCVNAIESPVCVCCSWHGTFDHDPKRLEEAFRQLMAHCPEILNILPLRPRKAPWWVALRLKWRRFWLFRKRLDLSA